MPGMVGADLSTAIRNALASLYGATTPAQQASIKAAADALSIAIVQYIQSNAVVNVGNHVHAGVTTGEGASAPATATGTIS